MAAARDQAARIVRAGPDTAEGEPARETSAALADRLGVHLDRHRQRPLKHQVDLLLTPVAMNALQLPGALLSPLPGFSLSSS